MRVVVGYVVLLAVALAAALVVTRQVLLTRVDRQIEESQAQEVEELRTLADVTDPVTGEPLASDASALFELFLRRNVADSDEAFYTFLAGEPFLYSFDAPTAVLDDATLIAEWATVREPRRGVADTPDGEVRYLAVPVAGSDGGVEGTFVVAFYPAADRAEINQAMRTIVLVGLIVLAAASLAAWSLAGRVLRPVRELTATAQRIEESDLGARIPVTGDDELAELGRTFNAMLERLESSFTSQREFLDDVAHELRTPITIVRGHLELLGDDPVERRETLELVTDELDRMARYVSDLLLVAKAARPDFLQLSAVDVRELVDGVISRSRGLAPREWQLGAAPMPGEVLVEADEGRLSQALLALVTNAVQHTPEGSLIEISATSTPDEVQLAVTDHGPGVDPQVVGRLFTRFSRPTSSEAGRPEGTGLGLAIVAAIAEAHGGRADVDSTPGQGATFRLTLPRRDHRRNHREET